MTEMEAWNLVKGEPLTCHNIKTGVIETANFHHIDDEGIMYSDTQLIMNQNGGCNFFDIEGMMRDPPTIYVIKSNGSLGTWRCSYVHHQRKDYTYRCKKCCRDVCMNLRMRDYEKYIRGQAAFFESESPAVRMMVFRFLCQECANVHLLAK